MSNSKISSRTVILAEENIDTDQIIPARFLTTTTRTGLGEHLFHAWRFDASGKPRPDFVLNKSDAAACRILVAGRNFGCGSSREHAAWALADFGIRAVISTEIADIFRSNALKNNIVPVVVDEDMHAWLLGNPGARVTIDVAGGIVELPGGRTCPLPIDAFARHCLVNDLDELGFLLTQADAIAAHEEKSQA